MRSKLISFGAGGVLMLALVVTGCSNEPAADKNASRPASTAPAPAGVGKLALPVTGKVMEVFESAGYSYMRLETAGGEQWVATGTNGFVVGDTVSIREGQLMLDFYSRSMDRIFPEIIFASSLSGDAKAQDVSPPAAESGSNSFAAALQNEQFSGGSVPAARQEGSPGTMSGMSAGMGRAPAEVPLADIKVEKAEGTNAYRVAELHQRAKELHGREVTVRGQVMKVSPQIMGRNWIHLQDGSGEIANSTHNLVVTAEAVPAKGEVVTVRGIFQADKDIGAGYRYAALVEQAQIIK